MLDVASGKTIDPLQDHRVRTFERVQQPAEPRVDHRELAAVLRAHLSRLALVDDALGDRADRVRRPDEVLRPIPPVVVHRRVRLGRVERLVRIELVDEQE